MYKFQNTVKCVQLQVLVAVAMKNSIFWNLKPPNLAKICRLFGRTWYLHLWVKDVFSKFRRCFTKLHDATSQKKLFLLLIQSESLAAIITHSKNVVAD